MEESVLETRIVNVVGVVVLAREFRIGSRLDRFTTDSNPVDVAVDAEKVITVYTSTR